MLCISQVHFYLTLLKQSLIKIQEVQVDAIDIQLMLIGVIHEVHLADYKYAYLVQIIGQDPFLLFWSPFTDYYANVLLQAS